MNTISQSTASSGRIIHYRTEKMDQIMLQLAFNEILDHGINIGVSEMPVS